MQPAAAAADEVERSSEREADSAGLLRRVALDAIVARQAPRARGDWLAEDLLLLLSRLTPAEGAGLAAQLDWLEQLVRWLRARRSGFGAGAPGALSSARLRLLLEALRQMPDLAAALARLTAAVLGCTRRLQLFTEVGLPVEQGFLGEACDRLIGKVLPKPEDDRDLAALVARLFPHRRDADWLEELAPELAAELCALLGAPAGEGAGEPLRESMIDALLVLAARVSAIGLAADVRERSADEPLAECPFLRIPRVCDALAFALQSPSASRPYRIASAAGACRATLVRCRWSLLSVHEHLEKSGISVDLVWRLERANKTLDRMSAILAVLAPLEAATPMERAATRVQLVASLVRERLEDASLRSLLRTSAHKLAGKVIERAGRTGEHYITRSRPAWHRMITSAAGGGLLTAATVALKFTLLAAAVPIFFEGLFSTFNYAGSFLLMQLFGFTLATKQPAMTAAALAAAMHPRHRSRHSAPGSADRAGIDAPRLAEMIARITRSQLAAIIGNLGAVLPAALALDAVWRLVSGRSFLDAETAHHIVASLHPTRSGTLVFAALTGMMLWLASLGAGWLENWVVFRRLPEAVLGSRRLRRLLGDARVDRLGRALTQESAGVGGSITLGTLLGMVPALGRFVGAPLEVRHVTLSTGALALAGCALGPTHLEGSFLAAAAGIGCIALLNFGVSFALALGVAVRGRDVSTRDQGALFRALLQRLRRAPGSFIVAPSDEP